jgi:hypothetical protein
LDANFLKFIKGDDSVSLCKVNSTGSSVETYYNTVKALPSLVNPAEPWLGISKQNITIENGVLTCSFTKLKSIPNLSGTYFDLKEKYYILFAYGNVNSSSTRPFNRHMVTSSTIVKYSLLNEQTITSYTYKQDIFTLTWTLDDFNPDFIEFSLSTILTNVNISDKNQVWNGFALSYDQLMTDDSVTLCRVNDSDRRVESYYNTGKNRSSLIDEDIPELGISYAQIDLVDDVLTCKFKKLKSIPKYDQYFDMNEEFYLLFGVGYLDNSSAPFRKHKVVAVSPTMYALGQKQSSITNTLKESVFTLAWTVDGTESTKFSLEVKTNRTDSVWSAFGLSYDKIMVNYSE